MKKCFFILSFALSFTFSFPSFSYVLETLPLSMSSYSMGVVNNITVDDPGELERFLQTTSAPVLIEIYASWCPACKQMGPVLDEVARRTGTFAYIIKADYEIVPQVAKLFPFSKIPTMFFYKNASEALNPVVGYMPAFKVIGLLNSMK